MKFRIAHKITTILWLVGLFSTLPTIWGGLYGADVETVADRRLLSIVAAEQELQQRATIGAGEETLLLLAQEIASRYERFLADNPEHAYAWILAGKFLRSIGDDQRALLAFLRANSLTPGQAVLQQQIGQIFAESGDYELALPYFLEAAELAPEEAIYHEDIGLFLMAYGRLLEDDEVLAEGHALTLAHEAFTMARQLDPENFERWWRWAESFADLPDPDWEAAILAWEKTLDLADSTLRKEAVWLQLARANQMAGNEEAATDWLDREITTPALRSTWEKLRYR